MGKYITILSWDYCLDSKSFDRCVIRPAELDDNDLDGFNYVGRGGDEGADIFISDNIKDAIVHSGFNPKCIQFDNLSEQDKKEKDKLVETLVWDSSEGFINVNS